MRLPGKLRKIGLATGLVAGLSACAGGAGGYDLEPGVDYYAVDRAVPTPEAAINGPQADFPQVLGEPFVVDGQTFTPADVLSYDAVGYATLDMIGGTAVTVSHKTLPLPSYVELTALDTGRTILARAERRGPMTASRIVGLSQGAARELGVGEGAPVRVRRVNAPEYERAALRAGQPAGSRLDTPDTLLAVLRKQLPAAGSASLARSGPSTSARGFAERSDDFDQAFAEIDPGPSTAVDDGYEDYQVDDTRPPDSLPTTYALAPIGERPTGAAGMPAPVEVARLPAQRYPPPAQRYPTPAQRYPTPVPQQTVPVERVAPARIEQPPQGRYIVQVATFTSRDNAIEAADELSGFVVRSGPYLRLRMGPYATRGEAEAALAKARRAGYRDAFVDTSE